ncbi:MAG: ATP-binding protein [Burkholderiales bacterium]
MENILVAVDNRFHSKLITELLRHNYNIHTYSNDIKNTSKYDLIIIDRKMFSCLSDRNIKLKNASVALFQPILLISSKKGVSQITSRMWQTIDELVTTPISRMELFSAVEILLRARRQSILLNQMSSGLGQKNDLLQRESSIMTDYFANVSHELRTPLAVILSGIDFLSACFSEDIIKPEACRNTLNISKKSCHRLLRIINNLLDITRIKSGYMNVSLSNIDIKEKIAEIVESVKDYAEKKRISLNFFSDTRCHYIAVDEDMIDRIVLNLLSNALKYTPEQGAISVILQDSHIPGNILISVKDNGIGIPPEKHRLIFDRFAQVDESMTKRAEGCGLGLSLAKSLVELLGGSIWVESKPGLGSKFTVELPVKTAAPRSSRRFAPDISSRVYYELSDL